MSNSVITLGFDYESMKKGIKRPVYWEYSKSPHLLIAGITGGGKTVLTKYIAYQILAMGAELYIADYKAGGDWNNIVSKYGEYTDCDRILDEFYDDFLDAIENKRFNCCKFLIFDEFVSFALSKDSKAFNQLMAKLSHIAFMSRIYGFHVIITSQVFNAKVIDTAIRDQFATRIYVGQTISLESQRMLFPDSEIDKSQRLQRYCGYYSTLDVGLGIIQIPKISDIQAFNRLLSLLGKEDVGLDDAKQKP